MDRAEHAVDLFRQGCSCSQSILLPWATDLGLDENTAARLAAPFGGGMRVGGPCGAFNGAVMVLGLATCRDDCTKGEGRAAVGARVSALVEGFRARAGAVECPGVIGCDVRDQDAAARIREEGLVEKRCVPAVRAAAEIVEELLA